jgi:hypothetical protein
VRSSEDAYILSDQAQPTLGDLFAMQVHCVPWEALKNVFCFFGPQVDIVRLVQF